MSTSEVLLGDDLQAADTAEGVPRASWRRLGVELRRSKKGIAGLAMVTVFVFAALAGPVLSPYGQNEQEFQLANTGPALSHPLGGDELGRDVLTRTLHGARLSIGLALLVVTISAAIGTVLGALAGYLGGTWDALIMRTADFMLVFPWLLLALLLITVLGPGFRGIVIALCAFFWLTYARVARAETLKLRELEFVEAARAIGSSKKRVLFAHVLPNLSHLIIVLATLDLTVVMIAEAGLSYLGLGFQPPTPTLGGMIAEGQTYLSDSPWIMLGPAAFLTALVIGVNLLGDWLRDTLDPSLRVQ